MGGADVNVLDKTRKTVFEILPQNNREEIAKLFAEHGSKKETKVPAAVGQGLSEDDRKEVAILLADASKREVECPICLDPCKSNEQVTALPCGHVFHTACVSSELKVGKPCPTCREMPVALDARTLDERLLLAAQRGDLATVQLMLTQGADMNAHNEAGHSVLFVASTGGYGALVETLLTYAGINRIAGLNESLIIAAAKKHKQVVRMLLQHGALFDKNNPTVAGVVGGLLGENALLLAVMMSGVNEVCTELARETNVSIIQEALLLAIAQGHSAIVERLIGYFVDNGKAEYLVKEPLEKVKIVCARCQKDALVERYKKIERLLVSGSPMILGMRIIPSAALRSFAP